MLYVLLDLPRRLAWGAIGFILLVVLASIGCSIKGSVSGGGGVSQPIGISAGSFSYNAGSGNPANQFLTISKIGAGTLSWTATDNATWLTLSPSSGTITTGTSVVTVSVNITGLTPNTYTATITIKDAGGKHTRRVTVTLTVVGVVPTVTTPPADQTVTVGSTATFAVVAGGTPPFSYQWQKNGSNIVGATGASYTTLATVIGDNGSTYRAVVTNAYGSVTSSSGTLTVNGVAPSVTTAPTDQTVSVGSTGTFSVVAAGTPTLSYQWQKNTVDIGGATGASYTTPATVFGDDGSSFRVVITNTWGTATSAAATLNVNGIVPSITTDPTSQTVAVGAPVSFSVVAAGSVPLNYQWQRNTVDIPGATASTYTLGATAGADNAASFRAVVTNAWGSANSAAAVLTVTGTAPTITTPPSDTTTASGLTATFSAVASGSPVLTYQWQKNSADIPGATSPSYTTPATVVGDNGAMYRVIVTNTWGSTPSAAATLTVNTTVTTMSLSAPTITINTATDGGSEPTLTITNTGTGTMTWTIASDQTWLRVVPSSGATTFGTPTVVKLRYYASLLGTGAHGANLTVSSPEATNAPLGCAVTLNVAPVDTFESTAVYLRTVHVSPTGNDALADGSVAKPYRTLRAALENAVAGDLIQLTAGAFDGWPMATPLSVAGTAANPIKIQGDPAGGTQFVCSGANNARAIWLDTPAFLIIQDIAITAFASRGIAIDAGLWSTTRAHHVIIRRVKLSGGTASAVTGIRLLNTDSSLVEQCDLTMPATNPASGGPVEFNGGKHNTVQNCYIHDVLFNAVRLNSQCEDTLEYANKLENISNRGLHLDGFRNNAIANLTVNCQRPIIFEAAEECLAANNTFYLPKTYCLWFSQPTDPFITKNGRVINNIFVFKNSDLSAYCNNGVNSFPATFQYRNNAWYSLDVPGFVGPVGTAAAEVSPLYQANPLFVNVATENFHLGAASGLRGNGMALPEVPFDLDGNAFASPPARGCYENQVRPVIGLTQTTMTFNATAGAEPAAAQTSDVSNTGPAGTVLAFTATVDQPWLAVSPASGSLASGTAATLNVTASAVVAEQWSATNLQNSGAPSIRERHSMVWTGTQMIVWGGDPGTGGLNTGNSYFPATDTWSGTAVTTTGAPSARQQHIAVWTGSKMIVWGGDDGLTALVDGGGLYDPVTNAWTAIATTNEPSLRRSPSAVWTGTEMIVWGGFTSVNTGLPVTGDGARYNPTTNTWDPTPIATLNAPSARGYHKAVWTGTEMIVWGGDDGVNVLNDGGRYNPTTDTWSTTAMATVGAPAGLKSFSAVWTGSQMLVWGGDTDEAQTTQTNTGGIYDPATNAWTGTLSTTNAPVARHGQAAIWTGTQMLVWGGYKANTNTFLNDGKRYTPGVALTPGVYTGNVNIVDASATNSPQAIAVTFNVSAGGTHLDFGVRPSRIEQAGPVATTHFSFFTVEIRDAAGAVVTTDNSTQITVGPGAALGTLSGTLTKTVVNGVALFDDLSIDAPNSLTLTVSSTPSLPFSGTPATIDVQAAYPAGQLLTRVNVGPGGAQMLGTGGARGVYLSSDGRYATYIAKSNNLIPGTTYTTALQFRYDRVTGKTIAISLTPAGQQPTQAFGIDDNLSAITANGRFVTYSSVGTDIVAPDGNGAKDVFTRDIQMIASDRNSLTYTGGESNALSLYSTISADGRFVCFESGASNLVASDTNASGDSFVFDRWQKTIQLVALSTGGIQGAGYNHTPYISGNGRYVAFSSGASNLVAGDTNGGADDVFLRDLVAGTTVRISTDALGGESDGFSQVLGISYDGTYVLFWSVATNLVPGDTNGYRDVFEKNTVTGAIDRVSVATGGQQGDGDSDGGVFGNGGVSGDGRYSVFLSKATNLDGADTKGVQDAFLHDRVTGVTRKLSIGYDGTEANAITEYVSVSEDGGYVGFTSTASNIVVDDTNGISDAFVMANPLASAAPVLQLGANRMLFNVTRGITVPSSQKLTVTDAGVGALSWTITSDQPWATVLPASGSTTGTDIVTITVDGTGLSAGYHYANLVVTGAGAAHSPQNVEITFAVQPRPDIGLSPTTLTFTAVLGQSNPPAQTVTVSNVGDNGSTLVWDASSQQAWLHLTAPVGGAIPYLTNNLSVSTVMEQIEAWNGVTTTTSAPSGREDCSAVWTGSEMIIWGGWNGSALNTGGRYNPATNTWTATSTSGAPTARRMHTAVWLRGQMIVWGGYDGASTLRNDGASYDPAGDSWTALPTLNAPTPRRQHCAVAAGDEMIVFGGYDGASTNSGGRFDLRTFTWSTTPTSVVNAPSPRQAPSAVWTGSEMLVWGGFDGTYLNTGNRYNPVTDTWSVTPISTVNAPAARANACACWANDEMIVWSGLSSGTRLQSGGRYNAATDTWSAVTLAGAPSARSSPGAVWTGAAMITWGGYDGTSYQNAGAYYYPPIHLSPGTYAGTITVFDPLASNNPQTIAVSLSVDFDFHVTAMSPAPASTQLSSPTQITLNFSSPADTATVNPQTILLVGSGGDGTFNDGNETTITPDGVSLTTATQATIDLSSVTLVPDTYQVVARADSSAGNALTFDGVDDVVNVPDGAGLNPTAALTLEAWVNFSLGGSGNPRLVSKGSGYYELFTVGTGSGRKFGAICGGQNLTSTNSFAAGSWHHVAVTYDASNFDLYVDGVLEATTASAGALTANAQALQFGQQSGTGSNHFKGSLDDVRIWSSARTQVELQASRRRNLAGSTSGLVGLWRMNAASGQTVADSSVFGNDGTLGADNSVAADDPTRAASGAGIDGVLNTTGFALDGEFSGSLPSGNGSAGGDFQATYVQQ